MLAEIDPSIYDVAGKPVAAIRKRYRLAGPSVPFGRYFSQPLAHHCSSLDDVRLFLRRCRYASDQQQFGKDDYWLPPERFELTLRGDCEDFALWTWRQLVHLGYECRFVGGSAGFYGAGHAWLTVQIDGRPFLLEPQARRSKRLARLAVSGYSPVFSVEWSGAGPKFFEHEPTKRYQRIGPYLKLGPEWVWYRFRQIVRILGKLAVLPVRWIVRLGKGE